jgi:hypothetical protein
MYFGGQAGLLDGLGLRSVVGFAELDILMLDAPRDAGVKIGMIGHSFGRSMRRSDAGLPMVARSKDRDGYRQWEYNSCANHHR